MSLHEEYEGNLASSSFNSVLSLKNYICLTALYTTSVLFVGKLEEILFTTY